jgi:hypothetical protein
VTLLIDGPIQEVARKVARISTSGSTHEQAAGDGND